MKKNCALRGVGYAAVVDVEIISQSAVKQEKDVYTL